MRGATIQGTGRCQALWDRVSLYLPVLLMGALALGSYAIVQRVPMPATPTPQPPLAQGQPDYRLENFVWHRYGPDGQLVLTVHGRQLDHFPVSQDSRVLQARLIRYDRRRGLRTEARADTLHTDDERRAYRLEGDVHVVREAMPATPRPTTTPRLTIAGETLTWLTAERLLLSEQPVRITRGTDTLHGNRLRYDEASGVLDLQGRVRATLVARSAARQ